MSVGMPTVESAVLEGGINGSEGRTISIGSHICRFVLFAPCLLQGFCISHISVFLGD